MGSQDAPSINYEVYTYNGQRWTLHARYDRTQREEAVADAKNVEQTMKFCARVVKETYFATSNISEETLVYPGNPALKSAAMRRANAVYRGPAGAPMRGRTGAPASESRRQENPATPAATFSTFSRLLIVIAAALALAGMAAGAAKVFLESPDARQVLTPVTASTLEFASFVVIFLGSAVPLAVKMVQWRPAPRQATARDGVARVARRRPASAPLPEELAPEEFDGDDEVVDWEGGEDDDMPLPPYGEPFDSLTIDGEGADEDDHADGEESDRERAAEERTALDPVPADTAPADDTDARQPAVPAETFDTLRVKFIQFLKELLAEVRKTRPNLDAYNVFGVQLFLAGGVDCLGNEHGLNQADRRELLKAAIDTLGGKPESSKVFAERYEEYLVEPKYMSMLQTGRSTMEMFLADTEGTLEEIARVFQRWNKPQKAAEQASARIMTVVFTDMVGSTDLTQARGDQGAQHVVRRHNTIVRAALAQYSGKEIKHTGDGIMASFGSATNGVACCMLIQQQIADHNAKRPDLPLHVRIGINAGEPIEEENDIFGSTVQLSARVCAKCETDEILVTNVVKELASGKGIEFEAIGIQELKGFRDPVPLFRVRWR